MTNPQKTAIAFVLDRSSSMGVVREETIQGVNAFLNDQEHVPGEVLSSLTLFDTVVERRFSNCPIADVPPMTLDTYQPRGFTALYDAVGQTIISLGQELDRLPEEEKPGKVLVVIQTDGQENSSREFTADRVKQLIEQQRNEWQWEFLFLGADQDAWKGAAMLGIDRAHTVSYTNNGDSTHVMYQTVSNSVAAYRGGVALNTALGPDGIDLRK